MDRNSASGTYGCFDRRYWSWRIGDMPNASLQHGVYPLTWLWKNDITGKYRDNGNLLEWIIASLGYWAKIQNKNGSFNQFFPNEQSVGTTYYTLSAILYAYESVKRFLNDDLNKRIGNAICKSSEFILKNDETYAVISNHLALFAYVNYKLYCFRNDKRFLRKAENLLGTIFKNQSSEGWFLEYEGPDPGYQTQCIYYLAEHYLLSRGPMILERIKDSVKGFLIYFFHPDGSFGGQYGSRDTEIIYPAGFEMLKDKIPECRAISSFIRESIKNGIAVSLDSLDDENLIRLSSNYLVAYGYSGMGSENNGHCGRDQVFPFAKDRTEKDFKDAGIAVRGNKMYYSVTNMKKGGLIRVFDKNRRMLAYEDHGYFFQIGDSVIANQITQNNLSLMKPSEIQCESGCYKVLDKMLTPSMNIILRLLSLTVFKNIFFTNLFRKILIKAAFTGKKESPVYVRRRIEYYNDRISITDDIAKKKGLCIKRTITGRKAFCVKMASSNYHSWNDMLEIVRPKIDIDKLNRNNSVKVFKEITFNQ